MYCGDEGKPGGDVGCDGLPLDGVADGLAEGGVADGLAEDGGVAGGLAEVGGVAGGLAEDGGVAGGLAEEEDGEDPTAASWLLVLEPATQSVSKFLLRSVTTLAFMWKFPQESPSWTV